MTHLSISLLGPLYVTLGDSPITNFGYDHVRALLAYLAVEADRPHRREALAGLLWPNQPDQTALESLRHALYRLQQALGNQQANPPFILVTRNALQFNTHSDALLDTLLFERLMPPAAQEATEDKISRLERAAAIYRGAFLQGFSLGSSYALEEWLLQKREQFDRQMSGALFQLVRTCMRRGEHEKAEDYARRALILDPWSEHMHRQLMAIMALKGRRGAALAQYNTLRNSLRDEFGVEPEPETVALSARISGNEISTSAKLPAQPYERKEIPCLPFVGREADLLRLNRCLGEALEGRGGGIFVTGEAGAGKTLLATEFARRAMSAHPKLVVACGSCSAQGEIGDPYLPFREVMQSLSGDVSVPLPDGSIPRTYTDRQWAIAPVTIQALVEVGPSLIHRLVAAKPLGLRAESLFQRLPKGAKQAQWLEELTEIIKQPPRYDKDEAFPPQADLFSQYTRVLQIASQTQPILLILDDLQWADSGSLGLLFHLSRRLEGQRILIVGIYRSDALSSIHDDQHRRFGSIVSECQRKWGDCGIDLDRAEGHAFINALLDSEPNRLGDQFRETLYRHTTGHALFTTELLHSLREKGGLRRDGEQHWVEGAHLDWETLPPRVEIMIADRVARLPESLRAILSIASVEGDVFTAEVIARAQGVKEQQVWNYLSHGLAMRPGLIQPEVLIWQGNQSLSRYRFRHHLFRQYFYQHMDVIERAQLHRAVLAALEDLHGSANGALAGALAHHAEAAGLADQAAQRWLEAGQHAYSLSAYDEAVSLFHRSLAALTPLPNSPERAKRELETQLALAASLFIARGWGAPERGEAADRAYHLSLQLDETEHRIPLLLLLANSALGRLECQRALALAQEMLPLAQASHQPLYIATGQQMMGLCLLVVGETEQARAHLEDGLAALPLGAERRLALMLCLGTDTRVSLLIWLSYALWLLGYIDQSMQRLNDALHWAEMLGHPPTQAAALAMSCAVMSGIRHDMAAVLDHSDRLLQLADANRLPFARPWGLIYRSWAQALTGQAVEAVPQLRAGLQALQQTGTLATNLQMHCLLAEVYLRIGQTAEGLAVVEGALNEVERSGSCSYQAEMLRLKGELLLRADQSDAQGRAAAYFEQAIGVARQRRVRSLELRVAISLAHLRRRQGQPTEALASLAKVYNWFTEGHDTPDLQEARRLLEGFSI